MSCRPAVMPATRSFVVRRLDSVEQEIVLLKKAIGSECLDRVCKSLGILEREYFGLRYVDKNGEYLWVNLRNPLQEQLPPHCRPVMEMRVKYFIKPQKILQPVTRLHFYKQLKKDLLLGRLRPNSAATAAKLSALMAQIDKGEYRPGIQYHQKIVCPTENDNLDVRIRREHQKLAGVSAEVAVERFLNEVSTFELYGVELYSVSDGDRVPKIIGVGPQNIYMYSAGMDLLKKYSYSAVQYTAFHTRKFTAMMTSSNNGSSDQLELDLRSKAAAQALYRSITEFHTFFRRDTVNRMVRSAGYCKSLLGNFKGQNPDRFYFDVTRTHREVVDHVWAILHPNSDAPRPQISPSGSPTGDREEEMVPPLPPLPPPMRGMHRSRSMLAEQQRRSSHHPSFNRMPPLPPYSQRSHSTDGVNTRSGPSGMIRTFPHVHPFPHMTSRSSFNPYRSPVISEMGSDSDNQYASGGSDTYTTISEPAYVAMSSSSEGSVFRSDAYIASVNSECSAASHHHQRINSPPPLYTEIDPEHAAPLPNFTSSPHSTAQVVSPSIPVPGSGMMFNLDAASVLARTRELESELQRLKSAMTCRLCKLHPIGATFCPCGHTVCCYSCAQRLRTCWECDETVHSLQRMILA